MLIVVTTNHCRHRHRCCHDDENDGCVDCVMKLSNDSKSSSASTSNVLQQEQNKIAVEKVENGMGDPCRIINYTSDSVNKSDNHNDSNVMSLDTDGNV